MGSGGKSGLSKGAVGKVSDTVKKLNAKIKKLSKYTHYSVNMGTYAHEDYKDAMVQYLEETAKFQRAMGESDEIRQSAGGSVSVAKLGPKVGGDTNDSGNVRLNSRYMLYINTLKTTLPHEHTHNLVHSLITKELGYAQGTPEFTAAYENAVIERSINEAARLKYIDYWKKTHKEDLSGLSVYQLTQHSGMRAYATTDYSFAPTGAGIEVPSVASEYLVKAGYDWAKLKQTVPYAYFVLQELKKRTQGS